MCGINNLVQMPLNYGDDRITKVQRSEQVGMKSFVSVKMMVALFPAHHKSVIWSFYRVEDPGHRKRCTGLV